jgi:hypothetical protein
MQRTQNTGPFIAAIDFPPIGSGRRATTARYNPERFVDHLPNMRDELSFLQMAIFGYARVSTDGQSLASQDAQLHAAGCIKVYAEKVSGAKTDRPELAKLLKRLEPGDVLMVTRLDRLARSTRDLLNMLDTIAKADAGFKSLSDTWADTTTAHGRLMLTVLGRLG